MEPKTIKKFVEIAYSPEGRALLKKHHFYYASDIKKRISGAFCFEFLCRNCDHKEERGGMFGVCSFCTKIQNIIKSM